MASNKEIDLGVMTRVENLRSIWPDEAQDFMPWLAKEQNLKLLGDEDAKLRARCLVHVAATRARCELLVTATPALAGFLGSLANTANA